MPNSSAGRHSDDLRDPYDYAMSDEFISATRAIPYRTGFRSRRHAPETIKDLLALPDRDFDRWIRSLRRLPDRKREQPHPTIETSRRIITLEEEVGQLRKQVFELMRSLAARTPAASFAERKGGLNVPSRP